MSGVKVIRELLANDSRVLAVVPSDRVVAGVLRQRMSLPAITVHQVGDTEEPTLSRRTRSRLIRERVQVTVLANNWAEMKRVLKAVSLGPGVYTGLVKDVWVNSVLPLGANPEMPPEEDGIYEQSRDFMVTFQEIN